MAGTNNLHPLKLDELKGRPPSEVAALLEADLERGLSQEEAERSFSSAFFISGSCFPPELATRSLHSATHFKRANK